MMTFKVKWNFKPITSAATREISLNKEYSSDLRNAWTFLNENEMLLMTRYSIKIRKKEMKMKRK